MQSSSASRHIPGRASTGRLRGHRCGSVLRAGLARGAWPSGCRVRRARARRRATMSGRSAERSTRSVGIGGEVEQPDAGRVAGNLELPVAVADGFVGARSPEQGARHGGRVRGHEGQEVHAIDNAAGGERRAGCGGERREDIDELNGHGEALAGCDPRRPADEEGCSDAAFEEGALPSPIGLVDIAEARVPSAAVVVGEDDDGVLVDAFSLERRHHLSDAAVERSDHGSVDA